MAKYGKDVLSPEEAKQRKQEKKIKRALKIARLRPLKNFCFWLFGVLSTLGIVLGGVFITLKVTPLGSITGNSLSGVVSEDVTSKSLLDAILGFQDYDINDFPIIEKTLGEYMDDERVQAFKDYTLTPTPKLEDYSYVGGGKASDYYYKPTSMISTFADTDTYLPAFGGDGKLIAELRPAYDNGSLELYLEPLFNKKVSDALASIPTYLNYFEVADVLSMANFNSDLLNTLFDGITIGNIINDFNPEMLLERVTLDLFGGEEVLSDLNGFDFFSGYAQVKELPLVDANGTLIEGVPSLYYTQVIVGETDEDSVFARTFDDQGKLIKKYYKDSEGKVYTAQKVGATICYEINSFSDIPAGRIRYANLAKAPITDALELLGESIGRQDIKGIMQGFGLDVSNNATILLILGDYTVADFGKAPEDGGFDVGTIRLYNLMGENGSADGIFDILLLATGNMPEKGDMSDTEYQQAVADARQQFTLGDIESVNIEKITISQLGMEVFNKQTLQLLCNAINDNKREQHDASTGEYVVVTPENITLGDFKYFDQNDIKLSTFLGEYSENKELYDILAAAKGISSGEEASKTLTVGALSTKIVIDDIKLSVVMGEYSANKELYDLLASAKNYANGQEACEKLLIKDLKSISPQNIKLTAVLDDNTENAVIYNIIRQATGCKTNDEITIAHLNVKTNTKFSLNNVLLSSVLDPQDDKELYEVLKEIYPNKDVVNGLTIGDLADFEVVHVKIGTVLPANLNSELYKVFEDALNLGVVYEEDGVTVKYEAPEGANDDEKFANIPLEQLNARLDIQHMHLKTVIGEEATGNAIIDALISKNVTVGDIAEELDNQLLYNVYGEQCFIISESATGDKYRKETVLVDGEERVKFVLDNANGTYTLNKDCGVWLLWCFDVEQIDDATGKATVYVQSGFTMGQLQEGAGEVTQKITGATIRQLVDMGIIDDGEGFASETIYTLTIDGVVEMLDELLSLI